MKKITLLFISIIMLQCSSDKNEDSNSSTNLIGKWTYEKEIFYSSTNVLLGEIDLSKEECYHLSTSEFKPNNEFIRDSYNYDGKECVRKPVRTYKYSYSDGTLSIDESETFTVVENTKSVLKLKAINSDNSYTIGEFSKVN